MALTTILWRSNLRIAGQNYFGRSISNAAGNYIDRDTGELITKNMGNLESDPVIKGLKSELRSLKQELESLRKHKIQSKLEYRQGNKEQKKAANYFSLVRAIESVRQSLAEHGKVPEEFPFRVKTYDVGVDATNMSLKGRHGMQTINVEVERHHHSCYGMRVSVYVRRWLGLRQVLFECNVSTSPAQIYIDKIDDGLGNAFIFSTLEKSLQEEFKKYLETIGMKPSTIRFLAEYMATNKSDKKYAKFLGNLKHFFEL